MISIFNLTLAANESREVAITGEYFELRNAVYPVALIELLDRSGGVVSRLENPEQSDFVRPGRYETVRVTNGPTAQTIKHFYGTGDAGSRRTSGSVQVIGTVGVTGDVSVIDGGKARTIAGNAFMLSIASGPSAGNISQIQLWNPAGTGKNIILKAFNLGAGAGGLMRSGLVVVALANIAAPASLSKLGGGAAGAAQLRYANPAASTLANPSLSFYVNASDSRPIVLQEPIVLPPGNGYIIESTGVNVQIIGGYEWVEEPV